MRILPVSALLLLAVTVSSLGDDIAYETTSSGAFGTIDLTTGIFSSLGTSSQVIDAGLGVADATLYGASNGGNTLYTVSPVNGALTTVGNSSENYDTLGSTPSGGLFEVGVDGDLYSINPSNGTSTMIGATGVAIGSTRGLSNNATTLYYQDAGSLYQLNTSTGAATLIGTNSVGIGAIVQESGILYGGQNQPTISVDTLNVSNGVATTGPGVTGTSDRFEGLVPTAAVVPEPGSILLLLTGAGLMLALNVRCRRAK